MARAAEILDALEARASTSAEELAALIGVSKRTLASEVANLQDLLSGAASITQYSGRYRLLVADPARFRTLRAGLGGPSFNDPATRASFIFARLFRAGGPVRIEELATAMSVGRTTVVADLARVREMLAGTELKIEGRTHVGLRLTGPELQQRLHILRHHYPLAYPDGLDAVARIVTAFVAAEGLDSARANELTRWARVAVDRIHGGHRVGSLCSPHRRLVGTPAHAMAGRLADLLDAPFDDDEVVFLTLPVAGMRAPSDSLVAARLGDDDASSADLVRGILATIHSEMDIDLTGTSFLDEFARHLAYMLNRMKLKIWVDDSGVATIGQEFPVAHRMATLASRVIEEQVGLPVDSSEVGFLAAYFQVFLESAGRRATDPLRVAIIATNGLVTAELTRLQLGRLLPETTQYEILTRAAATADALRRRDLVVVTGDEDVDCAAPVLHVRRVLDRTALARELEALQLRLPGRTPASNAAVLTRALDEQRFFALPADTDYPDAVEYMIGHLEARGLADPGFGQRIRDRGALTPLDPYVGFPHATLPAADVLLAIGVIPRRPDEPGVRLIVLLGVPTEPDRGEDLLVALYDAVLRLGSRKALLDQLCQLTTYEEFFYFLATHQTEG